MIELYTWSTPNGRKISIALEEMELDYRSIPIDITKGQQFDPAFLKISPSNKIPAIKDGDTTLFESGAILMYLARKTGRFLAPEGSAEYWTTLKWLMWQMGSFSPILGQAHHFLFYNPGKSEYAEKRYNIESQKLYEVLDTHLANSEYIASDISIAEFAIWPWVSRYEYHQVDINQYPNIKRWYLQLAERPAFIRGYAEPINVNNIPIPR